MHKKHHTLALCNLLLVSIILIFPQQSDARDIRREKFYRSSHQSRYFLLGGEYHSDQNSKDYAVTLGFKRKNNRIIQSFDFEHEVEHKEYKTKGVLKTKELYDFEISSKHLIDDSNSYLNLYNRTNYDEFSKYYYDITNAIGMGHIFLDGAIEADLNIGYSDVKNYDSMVVINPTLQVKFDITDKFTITSKAYVFAKQFKHYYSHFNYNEEVKSRLSYKLNKKITLEFYHHYYKNRYVNSRKKVAYNIGRTSSLRMRYNF